MNSSRMETHSRFQTSGKHPFLLVLTSVQQILLLSYLNHLVHFGHPIYNEKGLDADTLRQIYKMKTMDNLGYRMT